MFLLKSNWIHLNGMQIFEKYTKQTYLQNAIFRYNSPILRQYIQLIQELEPKYFWSIQKIFNKYRKSGNFKKHI